MPNRRFQPLHKKSPNTLLIVEDSEQDYEMFMRVINKNDIKCVIHHSETGEEALNFLKNPDREKYPQPSVILLDLNLPGMDGRMVLQKIKSDPLFKFIPVVIFSTSSNPKDIEDCYSKGANSYVVKPMNMSLLQEYIQVMLANWLNVNMTFSSVL